MWLKSSAFRLFSGTARGTTFTTKLSGTAVGGKQA